MLMMIMHVKTKLLSERKFSAESVNLHTHKKVEQKKVVVM